MNNWPDWIALNWFLPSTIKSFSWANPMYLYAIAGLPIVFLFRWFVFSSNRQDLKLSISAQWIRGYWLRWFRWWPSLFFGLGLTFCLIALARPQRAVPQEEALSEGLSLVLALDISESMETKDLLPNRLEAAKTVARQFIQARVNDKLGLVIFAGEAFSLCPLTSDYQLLQSFLSEVHGGQIKASGTAIGSAIATSINRLRDDPGKSKAIILLSDGDNTAGTIGPETATELAKSFGIRIYTIAIGKKRAGEVDFGTLRKMALDSRGAFFSAVSGSALSNVFTEIDLLERSRFDELGLREMSDYYYVYLNWAICFLLIYLVLKNTPIGNVLED
ncbi:VWA domain-containing protein [Marinilongibacter aquaticus]|uniref:VWA domain-containing protein n=1 Tax=Marinilongibacter aquaticus TaxID=2975157 RepID=UPI0021BD043E|nr:VWA domain-containing protein [Marinilongibacter aquaticus]UBM57631.1 VWA domain-containing protein [Marinilongibacter aquaticus]